MSSTALFKARLKRFRRFGDVAVFAPTPIDDIDDRHDHDLLITQPCLYVPGDLLVSRQARTETDKFLAARKRESFLAEVLPGGAARYRVPDRNVPELALDIELGLRGADRRQKYKRRSDADIRAELDALELRPRESSLVSPNHCFTPTPVCGVGPADEPQPAEPIRVDTEDPAGCGVRIAVIDTGMFADTSQHPWLSSDVHFSLRDVERPDADGNGFIDPVSGHGYFVAGIIRRYAPQSTIFMERLFHRGTFISEAQLARALDETLDAEPHIINLSLTGQVWNGRPPLALRPVWRRLRGMTPEIVVVASAGNAGVNTPFWPAAQPEVLSVGAVTDEGDLPQHPDDFSNYGRWVNVYAHGVGIVNAFTTGQYRCEDPLVPRSRRTRVFEQPFCSWSGTSFSAPLVTGRIAARMTTDGVPAAVARDRVVAEAQAPSASMAAPRRAPDGSPIYIVW